MKMPSNNFSANGLEHEGGQDGQEGQSQPGPSHLFLVRLWAEDSNGGDAVWCGKVQHVTRGRANQFRDWPALIDSLMAMLPDSERVSRYWLIEE